MFFLTPSRASGVSFPVLAMIKGTMKKRALVVKKDGPPNKKGKKRTKPMVQSRLSWGTDKENRKPEEQPPGMLHFSLGPSKFPLIYFKNR